MTDSQEVMIVAEVRAGCGAHPSVALVDMVSDSDSDATIFYDGGLEQHADVDCTCLFCTRRAGLADRPGHGGSRKEGDVSVAASRNVVVEYLEALDGFIDDEDVFEDGVEEPGDRAANTASSDDYRSAASSTVSSRTSSVANSSFYSVDLGRDDDELCLRLERGEDGEDDGTEQEAAAAAAQDDEEELPPCGHDRWEDYMTDDADEEDPGEEEAAERRDAVDVESRDSQSAIVVVDRVRTA